MTFTLGATRILLLLRNAGGSMAYDAMTRRLDYPDVLLTDYAYLDAEGYMTYQNGRYTLTVEGGQAAARLASAI